MDEEALRAAVGDALSQAVSGEQEMVTRWVACAEVIGADGERALYTLAPSEAKPWDTLGMLTFATQMEQAATVHSFGDE